MCFSRSVEIHEQSHRNLHRKTHVLLIGVITKYLSIVEGLTSYTSCIT
ncbi:hypothetical protein [Sodalis glossinidius]|nr:hypothetical protein [Sodalis glossinidius]